jgi:hypothetical protein
VTSLTAPTTGVFFGGWIIDRQGGYKDETGKAAMDTLRTCCYFGLGAVGFAVPPAFGNNFWFNMGPPPPPPDQASSCQRPVHASTRASRG